ncbi:MULTISPECIES: helix-turn-helix domain-containing protein [Streptomyces]|uniref:helix-turn-helix domain-containing protein n=1 Tax=Streptomyces TaxID=1883 RepID=UPI00163C939A|nr:MULTISPECIES: helix-turn-helix transcriptional regulator [Streptomyces]MBC2876953.1 helix-turn-helix transcriptional regulator [Streptomyces sp. TYQ1024]UBI35979.1 helix-turn-helix transcriptional regulator [Streptomyces mobaraensis]UKW28572.1 helix-turn-helix transcriptional regulator [Streptomyces sp. TYQ1024]
MTAGTGKGRDGESQTPLEHFGEEVRLERERLGIDREDLGKEAFCGYSLVAKIEAGKRVPSPEFGEACDRLFPDSHGRFSRLAAFVLKCAFPQSFRKYVELEEIATVIRRFNCYLVPGLVQTEDYARAVMATGYARNQEDLVTARMARQRILERAHPPRLWVIVDEAALRRVYGGPEVMRGQLERLLTLADTVPHVVQVYPQSADHFHGVVSPFGLLSFDEGADVAHVEGLLGGRLTAEPHDVAVAQEAFSMLTAKALSPLDSSRLIESVLKECYQ